MKYFFIPLIISLLLLDACKEETVCDTAGYALPEISIISPEGSNFEVSSDTLFTFEFFFKAEAGLNTFSLNGNPIYAFTQGETESHFVFQSYFWESGKQEFTLYDLCNQSMSISLNMNVIYPSN